MGRRRLVPADAELLRLRDAGMTIQAMMATWKLSKTTIIRHFTRLRKSLPDGRIPRQEGTGLHGRQAENPVGRSSPVSNARLHAQYVAGTPVVEIAAEHGISTSQVYARIAAYRDGLGRDANRPSDRVLIALRAAGVTPSEMAAEYAVAHQTVRRWMASIDAERAGVLRRRTESRNGYMEARV